MIPKHLVSGCRTGVVIMALVAACDSGPAPLGTTGAGGAAAGGAAGAGASFGGGGAAGHLPATAGAAGSLTSAAGAGGAGAPAGGRNGGGNAGSGTVSAGGHCYVPDFPSTIPASGRHRVSNATLVVGGVPDGLEVLPHRVVMTLEGTVKDFTRDGDLVRRVCPPVDLDVPYDPEDWSVTAQGLALSPSGHEYLFVRSRSSQGPLPIRELVARRADGCGERVVAGLSSEWVVPLVLGIAFAGEATVCVAHQDRWGSEPRIDCFDALTGAPTVSPHTDPMPSCATLIGIKGAVACANISPADGVDDVSVVFPLDGGKPVELTGVVPGGTMDGTMYFVADREHGGRQLVQWTLAGGRKNAALSPVAIDTGHLVRKGDRFIVHTLDNTFAYLHPKTGGLETIVDAPCGEAPDPGAYNERDPRAYAADEKDLFWQCAGGDENHAIEGVWRQDL